MLYSYKNLGRNGRLGNQLFQIAGTIGRAKGSGNHLSARFPSWEYFEYFNVPSLYFDDTSESAFDLGNEYLQDIREFSQCEELVRDFFRPSSRAIDELQSAYGHLLAGHRTSVHVRRGDYVRMKQFHPPCSTGYFREAMAKVMETCPETTFFIFSDDIEWCIDQFEHSSQIVFISAHSSLNKVSQDVVEFNLMQTCDVHIISNSTFSWWAAYLADSSTVVAPDTWFGPELSHLDTGVLIPDSWVRLPSRWVGPQHAMELEISEAEDGLVVLNVAARRVHHLNSTASLLFELCTGDNTVESIIQTMAYLSEVLKLPEFDTNETLQMFFREGLIV